MTSRRDIARLAGLTLIGKIGLPSDMANIALLLASKESGYILAPRQLLTEEPSTILILKDKDFKR